MSSAKVSTRKDRSEISRLCAAEYQKESDQLGAAGPDAWIIECGIPPAWYWSLISALVANYPMVRFNYRPGIELINRIRRFTAFLPSITPIP